MAAPVRILADAQAGDLGVGIQAISVSNRVADLVEAECGRPVADVWDVYGQGGSIAEIHTMGNPLYGELQHVSEISGTNRVADFIETNHGQPWDELTKQAMFDISAIPIPGPPINLVCFPEDQINNLFWEAAEQAISYKIYRSFTPGGPYTLIATSETTSYVHTGLTNGRTYFYVVTGVNEEGEGEGSNEASGTPYPPSSFEVIYMYDYETRKLNYLVDLSPYEMRLVAAIDVGPGEVVLTSAFTTMGHPKGMFIIAPDATEGSLAYDVGNGYIPILTKFVSQDFHQSSPLTLKIQSSIKTKILVSVAGDR